MRCHKRNSTVLLLFYFIIELYKWNLRGIVTVIPVKNVSVCYGPYWQQILIFIPAWSRTGLKSLAGSPLRILKPERLKDIFRVLTSLYVSLKLGTWVMHSWLDFLCNELWLSIGFNTYSKCNLNVNGFVLIY